jgi:hypothetical protein
MNLIPRNLGSGNLNRLKISLDPFMGSVDKPQDSCSIARWRSQALWRCSRNSCAACCSRVPISASVTGKDREPRKQASRARQAMPLSTVLSTDWRTINLASIRTCARRAKKADSTGAVLELRAARQDCAKPSKARNLRVTPFMEFNQHERARQAGGRAPACLAGPRESAAGAG